VPWLSASLSGQWSPHGLPAYEEYQIGNYTVGRGYDPGAASGDRGLGMQLEAGAEVPVRGLSRVLGDTSLGLFGFYDTARVWNEDPLSYDSTIASVGGGVRMRFPRTQLSLFYADPLKRPFPSAEKPRGRLLVTLTRTFSIR
jgi:hemolysin activation/secretion protein